MATKNKDIELPKITYGVGEPADSVSSLYYIDEETGVTYEKSLGAWQPREKYVQERFII